MTPLPDFDTLKWMAENDPEGLETLQNRLNREAIETSEGNQAQLESLVFSLEYQLSRCSNPYQRCIVAMTMMRSKLCTLQSAMNEPDFLYRTGADVIPLFKG